MHSVEWLFGLPIILPLLLSLFGLKARQWQFGVLANIVIWSAVILRWKQHPMAWWELVIMAVLLLLLCTSAYDDLTPGEFRKGRRPGRGLDYWFERGSILWRVFRRKD
jgi:hypothetical protein